MKIERWDTGEIIFELECSSWSDLVRGAIKAKVSLYRANLSSADLSSTDLRYADLRYADLSSADLRYADLRYADLRYADLSSADLRYAVGNMVEVKSIQIDTYLISFDSKKLNIGCESYTFEEWKNFTDEKISKMDSEALVWWQKWKDFIFKAIELSEKD